MRVHDQIQDRLFGAPGDADRGLGNLISRVATAAETLAAGPDQSALAQGFVGAAQDLARGIATAGARCRASAASSTAASAAPLPTINGDLAELAELNEAHRPDRRRARAARPA